jgi:hypothetical protein
MTSFGNDGRWQSVEIALREELGLSTGPPPGPPPGRAVRGPVPDPIPPSTPAGSPPPSARADDEAIPSDPIEAQPPTDSRLAESGLARAVAEVTGFLRLFDSDSIDRHFENVPLNLLDVTATSAGPSSSASSQSEGESESDSESEPESDSESGSERNSGRLYDGTATVVRGPYGERIAINPPRLHVAVLEAARVRPGFKVHD